MCLNSLFSASGLHIFKTIHEKLNFSIEAVRIFEGNIGQDIQRQMELSNIDLTWFPYPQSFNGWDETQRIVSVFSDEFCAVVPLLPRWEFSWTSEFYLAHVLSVSILLIIWICTRLLRLNPKVVIHLTNIRNASRTTTNHSTGWFASGSWAIPWRSSFWFVKSFITGYRCK